MFSTLEQELITELVIKPALNFWKQQIMNPVFDNGDIFSSFLKYSGKKEINFDEIKFEKVFTLYLTDFLFKMLQLEETSSFFLTSDYSAEGLLKEILVDSGNIILIDQISWKTNMIIQRNENSIITVKTKVGYGKQFQELIKVDFLGYISKAPKNRPFHWTDTVIDYKTDYTDYYYKIN